MNFMKFITVISLSLFINTTTNAQCLKKSIFKIDSIGTYKDKLPIPLFVAFQNDSVVVSPNREMKNKLMVFKILSQLKCQWNDSFSEGITSYNVQLLDSPDKTKVATINLIYKNAETRYIEILYDKSEERVLTIQEVLQ